MEPGLRERLGLGERSTPSDEITVDATAKARVLMYLFVGGATITLLSLPFSDPAAADTTRTITTAVSGYAIALVLLLGYERLPTWSFFVFLAAATMLIEWAIYASGESTSPYAMFYFWIAIYAFYFFTRAQAVMQMLVIALAYAGVLLFIDDPTSTTVMRWLITSSALVVAGALIGLLKDHVDTLAKTARVDPATGLLNRRGFRERLDTDIERARRGGDRVSVIVGELDGVEASGRRGEQALELAAEVVARTMRRMDTPGRIGHGEIALMAPDTNHEGASALAERLRAAIAKEFAARGDGVTVSLGVATFPDHAPSVEGVMHDAGQAVQAAQRLGGDCAVVYDVHVARSLFAAIGGPREQSGADLGAVLGLAEVLDIRDTGTSSHSQTVGRYTEAIARELGLPAVAVDRLRLGGLLHDIGKIAVPDAVLKKAGPLTEAEWERMRKHPEIGALMLDAANLEDISRWVAAHHERPDGLGYPHGLAADEIPLGAKIVAVADAYEAMTADRPYRKALTAADARAELRRCAGTHFDEAVVEAFLVVLDRGAASREPGGRRDRSVPAAGDA